MDPRFHRFLVVSPSHTVVTDRDVLSVLSPDLSSKLHEFLEKYAPVGATQQTLSEEEVVHFPFVDSRALRHETFSRKEDLRILSGLIGSLPENDRRALDVGPWNNWLSKWLTERNFTVLCTDLFLHSPYGLHTRHLHRDPRWLSLQADISEPGFFKGELDLIVLNHCIQFLPEPERVIEKYLGLLKTGGILAITGIDYKRDQKRQAEKVEAFRRRFFLQHHFEAHFYPCKGYVHNDLIHLLLRYGFRFEPYRVPLITRWRKKLLGDHCGVYYYQK